MKMRTIAGVLAGCVLTLNFSTATLSSAQAAPRPPGGALSPSGERSRAAAAATAWVATHPTELHASPDDQFVQSQVQSSAGWQYVPYERIYQGLPVVGGDFVVVVDPSGKVSSASVAQRREITGLGITPGVSRSAAEHAASRKLRSVDHVAGSRLVVDDRGGTARLAWESTVADGAGLLTVDVDATSGTVLDSRRAVYGSNAQSRTNGPFTVATTSSGGTYSLTDPVQHNLSCQDYTTHQTLTSTTDSWGTGAPTDKMTACADAMFAAQTETRMLSAWLGRNGMDGVGGAWPIRVGWPAVQDAYLPADPQVDIGYDYSYNWMSGIDLVGHEMGHGIDDHTPGGISGNGTAEFIADAFGISTKWYANEPASFNPANWTIGTKFDISERNFCACVEITPGCYSGETATMELHDAGMVGDHWFYLLSAGTNPTDGSPVSPSCNNTTVGGVGVQSALQILYNAMLMKTSASSYPAYRVWTLQAAKNLFPNDCTIFGTVRAAWDAVGVPVQPSEPQGCVDYVAAFADNDGALREAGTGSVLGAASGVPALANGTDPGVAALFTGGSQVAWHAASSNTLWTVDANGIGHDTGSAIATGDSPSVAALPGGGAETVFAAPDNLLRELGPDGVVRWVANGLGMSPGTRPAIAAGPRGGWEIAFHAWGEDTLWTVTPDNIGHDTGANIAPGSSPAITALPSGGYEIVFVGVDGKVRELDPDGVVRLVAGVPAAAASTSPAIAALPTGGFEVVFQAAGSSNTLWTITPGNTVTNTGAYPASGSSPAIAALPTGGFEVAFRAASGRLATLGAGGAVHESAVSARPGASPSIAISRVGSILGNGAKCVDMSGGGSANGTQVQLQSCNGTVAQNWTIANDATIRGQGRCLDVSGGSTADGAKVQLWDCNGTGAQVWQSGAADELRNPQSGKCLDATGGSTSDGTPLQIEPCTGGTNQKWSLPDYTVPSTVSGVIVPNVLSVDRTGATDAINAAGLTLGTVSTINNCVDTGSVQTQNPRGGELVALGSTVSITVSTCTSTGGDGGPIQPK